MSDSPIFVNDVHSRLNRTRVAGLLQPRDLDELRSAVRRAAERKLKLSIAGGRHAMGGQQFATDGLLLDITALNRPIRLDRSRGLLEMEAGADWPAVMRAAAELQPGDPRPWGIRQKQTGVDAVTLGGSVSANAHGRGLLMRPLVDDVESLTLVTASAEIVTCSRDENAELFSLVIGGYGLFGVIATVTLRLSPRVKVRRMVDILDIDEAIPAVRRRVSEGCTYGDFQYAIDPADDSFLRRGVCACYRPVDDDTPVSDESADLSHDDWVRLLRMAHTDKRRAFHEYGVHYLSTHGRVYWADAMQLSTYIPTYDQFVKEAQQQRADANDESLVIGELYVPPDALVEFLTRARLVLHETAVEDIYGTIRSSRQDAETFLPWARQDYACVIFNLCTEHTPAGIDRTARTFRSLHDAAIALGGSFFLTYHRFATREQVEACYPRMSEFLSLKSRFDPLGMFHSDWYEHVRRMFASP